MTKLKIISLSFLLIISLIACGSTSFAEVCYAANDEKVACSSTSVTRKTYSNVKTTSTCTFLGKVEKCPD
jgi:hypothetical protein